MDKLGVVTDEDVEVLDETKTPSVEEKSAAVAGLTTDAAPEAPVEVRCPKCGGSVQNPSTVNVKLCLTCGTLPFEG